MTDTITVIQREIQTVEVITQGPSGNTIDDTTTNTINTWSGSKVQSELDLKANLASPTFTGTVGGITAAMVGLPNVDNTSDADKPVSTAQLTALDAKLDDSQLNAANGVAPLGSDGKVPIANLPASVVGAVEFQGTWDANTNTPNLTVVQQKGNYFVVNVVGSTNLSGITDWNIGDWAISNGTTWDKVDNTDSVTSVAGKTGIITLIKADVGLPNVDDTSDINKPVSTATQTALDLKAPLASPAFTGVPTVPTAVAGTNTTQVASTAYVQTELGSLTKADVGLGNVDNTSDADKPVSTAQQTALDTKVNKAGDTMTGTLLLPDGSAAAPSIAFANDTDTGIFSAGVSALNIVVAGVTQAKAIATEFQIINQLRIGALSGTSVFLTDDAANTLAQRNGTNSQAFNLYNTFTDASNYERLSIKHDTNVITFVSEAAGTGTTRDFNFTGGNVGIGTVPTGKLSIRNLDVNAALFINQDGNGISLDIDSEATTADVINIDTPLLTSGIGLDFVNVNSLTTGKIARFSSNSADTSTRQLVFVFNDNSLATGTTALSIRQDAAQTAIFIDQNGNGSAIVIDSEATTAIVLDIDSPTGTSGNVVQIGQCNSLTTGKILNLHSNSASTSTRELVKIHNQNSLAVNATGLTIQQDAAQRALFIDQNAEGVAIEIDSEATTASTIKINDAKQTTGTVLELVNNNALTTGKIATFHSNSVDIGTRTLVEIINDNPLATGATALGIRQDAAKRAIFIDQNGNGPSLEIDSLATSASVINITTPATTTGDVFHADNCNSLTTGKIANFHSNSADTSARSLVFIHNDNILATAATTLRVVQDADNRALFIDQNGNGDALEIDSESTTTNVIDVSTSTTSGNVLRLANVDALTTGKIARFHSNSVSTSVRNLVEVVNDSTLATAATCLFIQQDAATQAMKIQQNAASSFIDYRGTITADTVNPISSLTTPGATQGFIQIEINGVKRWIQFVADPS